VIILKLILEKFSNSRNAVHKTGYEHGEAAGFLVIMEFANGTFPEGKEFIEFFGFKWYKNQSKVLQEGSEKT
jgi:hypothetical protein